jgi:hypothetical protein
MFKLCSAESAQDEKNPFIHVQLQPITQANSYKTAEGFSTLRGNLNSATEELIQLACRTYMRLRKACACFDQTSRKPVRAAQSKLANDVHAACSL